MADGVDVVGSRSDGSRGVDVSVVIPTRDGMEHLAAVIAALQSQETERRVELVAIDSGSTDGTVAFLRKHVDVFLEIEPAAFEHGATRNAGIAASRGELVVMLVQDAIPLGSGWLESLVEPLEADERVAGAYARQQARPGASALTRRAVERWMEPDAPPRTVDVDAEQMEALPPLERMERCTFDNVCSCLRRSVWEEQPLPSTPIAEDLLWSRDVLLAGWRIAYAPSAVVEHSHDRSVAYEFRRTWALHRVLWDTFGVRTIPRRRDLARSIAVTLRDHLATLLGGPRGDVALPVEVWRAIGLAVASPLAQYMGPRGLGRRWLGSRAF